MKIRFESDDNLPLGKILKFHMVAVVMRSVFKEDGKYYWQVFFGWMFVAVITMLHYDRIDVPEGIDINKTDASKECMLCHYSYFRDIGYDFEQHVWNGCYGKLMMAYELKKNSILNIKGVDYRFVWWGISRNEAVNILNNSVLEDKGNL